jgi:hypothetical protein
VTNHDTTTRLAIEQDANLSTIVPGKANTFFTGDIRFFYARDDEIDPVGGTTRQENEMNTFRTRKPLVVKATQCRQSTTIFTDCGQRKALPGDWIIEGENHRRYIVDNSFFKWIFAPSLTSPQAKDATMAVDRLLPDELAGPSSHRFDTTKRNATQETKIIAELKKTEIATPSNIRAEDGLFGSSQKASFREGVLVPLGSLFAVFMVILCIVLVTH